MKFLFLLFCFVLIACSGDCQNKADNKLNDLELKLAGSAEDTNKVVLLLAISDNTICVDTTRSLKAIADAKALSERLNWVKGRVLVCINRAKIYVKCEKNLSKAISSCNEGLTIANAYHDNIDEAAVYNYMGYIYYAFNNYGPALESYKKSISLDSNARAQISPLANSGIIYNNIGDYAHSLECYEKALGITRSLLLSPGSSKNDTLTYIGLLLTTGDVYVSMSQYDSAFANYHSALKVSRSIDQKYMQVWSLGEIGKVHRASGEMKNAIDAFDKALELSDSIKEHDRKPIILDEMANVYLAAGDALKALLYARRSLSIAEQYKDLLQLPKTNTTLGKISIRLKKYNEAVTYLSKALDICKQTGAIDDEKETWEALSKAYEQMGQTAKAFDAYRKFIKLRDSVYNVAKAKEMVRVELKSGFSRKQLADSVKQDDAKRIISLKLQKQRAFTIGGFAGLALVLALSFFIFRNYNHQKKANKEINRVNMRMQKEKHVSETLLLNILPDEVAQELKAEGKVHAKLYDSVTVLFTDFVNFTQAGERLSPQKLVEELDACFQGFDEIISKYNIEKIKTVGDAYLAVSGLPKSNPDHACDMVAAAIEMRDFMKARKEQLGDMTFGIRLGINSGSVVAGIVGIKKFAYDIWGDTVNTASRMEQNSEPGKINISETTYVLLKGKYNCIYRGKIDAKHKGLIDMYFVS